MKYISQKLKHLENKLNQFKTFHKTVTEIDFRSEKSKVFLLARLTLTLKMSIHNTCNFYIYLILISRLVFILINKECYLCTLNNLSLWKYLLIALDLKLVALFLAIDIYIFFQFIFHEFSFSDLKFEETKIFLSILFATNVTFTWN